ncbi:Centrin-3 [Tritrichomonas foetus]|uniref:Centrin-3 n=1 Tax=Tritrichomonas foetus TaxID=1144522 RepID=A0A1J4JHH3_9EUKA|nr:Centrin-3 [Tritrichomonas foetus]|eukprot:OHS98602.1 Centrin-3 [Tritrichomonas foetus]
MSRVTPTKSPRTPRTPKQSNRQLTRDQQREIREAFDIFDTDKSNSIDRHEFRVALTAMGIQMTKKEIMDLFDDYDPQGNVGLNRDQFERVITEKIRERDPLFEARKTFSLLDHDSTGKITLKNLKYAILDIQKNMTEELQLRKRKKLKDMTPEEIGALTPEEIQIRKDEEETARFVNQLLVMKDADLLAMIKEFDLDGDGQISYDEFLNILNPPSI